MSVAERLKSIACKKIDERRIGLNDISEKIWNHPELGFEETFAHDLLTTILEKEGFEVSRKMPLETAFIAKFGNSDGIKVGIVLEYDALPGIGHACGHNLIAEAGIGAALAMKAVLLEENSIKAQIIVFGTPAEEGGGGKVIMINKGCFEDVDFCIMAHPYVEDIIYHPELAVEHLQITYHGKASHASLSPWLGINALDAVAQCYTNISMLRQQMGPCWLVHGIITKGGDAPNVIPQIGQLMYYVRASTTSEKDAAKERVVACANAAAISTGCQVEIETIGYPYSNMMINSFLSDLFEKNGNNLGIEFKPNPPGMVGSTDMGNVSHVKPAIHPMFKIPTEGANHTRAFTEAAIKPESQEPTLNMAKCIAMTAIDIICNKDLLTKINEEFLQDLRDNK
eukprot:gene18905-20808_t